MSLNQELLIWISPVTSDYGWVIGVLLYCMIKLYREREDAKITVRRWTDTTNEEMLKILYPSWFEIIRASGLRLVFSAVFFIFIYCLVCRAILFMSS